MKLEESLIKQVEDLLNTKYSNEFGVSDQEDIEAMIDELLEVIRHKEEELEDYKEYVEENYKYKWNWE